MQVNNKRMRVGEVIAKIGAEVLCCRDSLDKEISLVIASDLMSEVLTVNDDNILLVSGLSNLQLVRTAEMLDIPAVIIVRGKDVTDEMIELASAKGIILAKSTDSMFTVCGILHDAGLISVS